VPKPVRDADFPAQTLVKEWETSGRFNTMNRQDSAAQAQISAIILEFENAGGTFSNPLPMGGKLQDIFNQLTTQFGGLDKLPSSLNALRNAIASYQALAADSYVLHQRYYLAMDRLNAALDHTVHPSAQNGGLQVDNTRYYVGFDKIPAASDLLGRLNTTHNAVSIQMTLNNFSSESSQLKISGGTSLSIPIADFLGLSIDASASYSISRYTSSATNLTMDIKYPGVTLFAAPPRNLTADNKTGWYANDILEEVANKTGQDVTGYQLNGSEYNVADLFGPGKAFSRLKTFVISQQPTITLTFMGANTDQLVKDLKIHASASLSLFDWFSLGSVSGSYEVQNVDTHSVAGGVVVTFGPPSPSGTIPLQQQVAYVLGGVASYPPDHI